MWCTTVGWHPRCDDVFIGPNATFTNDRYPRSKHHLSSYPETRIEDGASIGANATVLPGITIGQGAMVGAGSVVIHSVPQVMPSLLGTRHVLLIIPML